MALGQNSALLFTSVGLARQDRAHTGPHGQSREPPPRSRLARPDQANLSCSSSETEHSATSGAEELWTAPERPGLGRGARLYHPRSLHRHPQPCGMDLRSSCSKRCGPPGTSHSAHRHLYPRPPDVSLEHSLLWPASTCHSEALLRGQLLLHSAATQQMVQRPGQGKAGRHPCPSWPLRLRNRRWEGKA